MWLLRHVSTYARIHSRCIMSPSAAVAPATPRYILQSATCRKFDNGMGTEATQVERKNDGIILHFTSADRRNARGFAPALSFSCKLRDSGNSDDGNLFCQLSASIKISNETKTFVFLKLYFFISSPTATKTG